MSDNWSIDASKSVTRPLSSKERGDMTTKHYNGNGGYGVEDWLELGLSMANGAYNIASAQESKATQESWRKEDQAREDSVLQRARVDAEKAGFSPLAALSSNLGSSASPTPVDTRVNVNSPLSAIANRKYLREQLAMQRQLAEAQISNVGADTRDKNASADVNESTSAVQILKAKVELDNMIRAGQMSTSQIVGYLNDLKSQGISDSVIDSLLSSFEAEPQNPAAYLSGNKLTGNKLLNKEYDKVVQDIAESKQNVNASKAAAAYHTSLKNMSDAEFNAATKASSGAKDSRIVEQISQLEKKSKQNWTTITLPATTVAGRTIPAISISNPEELDYAARLYAALAMVETNANEASFQSLVRENPVLGALMRVLGKDGASNIFSTISGLFGR